MSNNETNKDIEKYAEIFKALTPWQVAQLSRHPQRPYSNDYFGLINEMNTYHPELHGYVVGMNGEVYVPEFRPRVSMDNRVKPN